MILRRMSDAVKRQDWFQVTIEILIVVIGIFLGLQVSEWNEARKDNAREGEYLTRLLKDIDVSIERNLENMDNLHRQVSYTGTMLKSLSTCTLTAEDAEIFANGLFMIGKNDPPVFVRDVYDDLKSTGNYQVIRNIELREAITNNASFVDQEQIIENKIYQRFLPSLQYLDHNRVLNIKEIASGIETVDTTKVIFDFQSLCLDKNISNAISNVEGSNYSLSFSYNTVLDGQRKIKALIEKELERFM
ncbi:MAG: hypothetical protein P8J14_04345 [Emcibacteraceae bacterium]|nr:hypothetical protein [Emcibacteraceae bacterium]